jgi:hypothetical protein
MVDKRIKDLLNTPDETYNKQLDILIQNIDESKEAIRDFCLGQKEAFRHLNGGALLLAVLNYVLDNQQVLKEGSVDFEKLLEYYDDWKNTLRNWNLKSLENFINELKAVDEQTYIYYSFNAVKQEYLKLFIVVVGKSMKEGKIQAGAFYPITYFEESFKNLPQEIEKGSYEFYAKLIDKLLKNVAKTNLLLSSFGIEVRELNKKDYWVRVNSNRPLKAFELLTTRDNQTKENKEEKHTIIQNLVKSGNMVKPVIISTDKEQISIKEENHHQLHQFPQLHQNLNKAISQSQEPTEDKNQEDTSDKLESKIIKKLKGLKRVRVSEIRDYFTEEEAKVILRMLDGGILVLEEKQEGVFVSLNEASQKTQDELAGKYSKLEKDIIEVIKDPPIGRRIYKFELISFLEQRGYKPEDIEKAVDKLIESGVIILFPDEKLEINFSKFGDG